MKAEHTMKIRKLNNTQLAHFDTEYVKGKLWVTVKKCIDQDFFNRPFSFLDIGGGNGIFTNKVLENYPNARATILDNSEFLLSKNEKKSDRKKIIYESVENIGKLFFGRKYDIIFMHWILHHLVADSYSNTLKNVKSILELSSKILNDKGRISIFENMYNGLVFDNLPGHIIYHLTSFKKLSKIIKRLGANTGGVGVCFRSKKAWTNLFENAGMIVIQYSHSDKWRVPFYKSLFLHIDNIRVGHFWLKFVNPDRRL